MIYSMVSDFLQTSILRAKNQLLILAILKDRQDFNMIGGISTYEEKIAEFRQMLYFVLGSVERCLR